MNDIPATGQVIVAVGRIKAAPVPTLDVSETPESPAPIETPEPEDAAFPNTGDSSNRPPMPKNTAVAEPEETKKLSSDKEVIEIKAKACANGKNLRILTIGKSVWFIGKKHLRGVRSLFAPEE